MRFLSAYFFSDWVSAAVCHPSDKYAYTASHDRSIKCWDMDNKIFVWERKDAHQGTIHIFFAKFHRVSGLSRAY